MGFQNGSVPLNMLILPSKCIPADHRSFCCYAKNSPQFLSISLSGNVLPKTACSILSAMTKEPGN